MKMEMLKILTSSLSRSPEDKCVYRNLPWIFSHWVPFPDPGPPSRNNIGLPRKWISIYYCHYCIMKLAENCKNFALSVQKEALAWKKYTTAGGGGGDLYQLCIPLLSLTKTNSTTRTRRSWWSWHNQCRYRLLRLSVWPTHQITAKSSPAATN